MNVDKQKVFAIY